MKRKVILVVFFIMLASSAIIFLTNKNGTIKKELRDFAVKDTSAITKIFLADKANNSVTLTRDKNQWKINNKYYARPDAINILLQTIATVHVKSPVSKPALKNVIKRLATKSIKIEIYKGIKLLKVYYVGEATPDQSGTYMVLENSSVPFVTQIPGFTGYLTVRYFTDESLWRDNSVFLYSYQDISSVLVYMQDNTAQSFTAFNDGNNKFRLQDFNKKEVAGFNVLTVKEYIALFKKVKCEAYLDEFFPKKRLDSLLNTKPFALISVTNRKGNINSIKLYRRPNTGEVYGGDGKLLPYNPDAMYGVLQDNKVVSLQYFVFDPLMKDISYFLNK